MARHCPRLLFINKLNKVLSFVELIFKCRDTEIVSKLPK